MANMQQPGPPPPPPPGAQRGPGGPGPGPMGMGRPPPPPQNRGPPGPQGLPPMQMPIRQQSSRIVDITPQKLLDEKECLKRLTTYAAFTIRKATPNGKEKPTWARSEVNDEKLSQEDILRQIKKLNEKGGRSVAEKKAALAHNQQGQVTNLLDDLAAKEHDRNFEWSLSQLDRREKVLKHGLKETLTMTVYVKRSPLKELNPIMLFQNIERARQDRLMQQNRPPPPPQHQPPPPQHPHPPPPPPGAHQVFKIDKKPSKSKIPKIVKGGNKHRDKRYNGGSSSDSDYSGSDTASDSEVSSSNDTSVSSSSRGNKRYKSKNRDRSFSRHREHRRQYLIDDRAYQPEPARFRGPAPYGPEPHHRFSVPDVPTRPMPGFDPVSAAYQAGKMDADAERFGLERERERERERYASPPRQVIIERPVVIERPPIGMDRGPPQAVVSYGRPEHHRHYSEPAPRYVDERFDEFRRSPPLREERYGSDYRSPRDAEYLVREAEEYMDRRGSREPPRVVYQNPNPFAPAPIHLPRRYPPSPSVTTSGW